MADDQSNKKTCELRLDLSRFGSVKTCYETKVGLGRNMALRGWVDDPGNAYNMESAFHRKACELTITSPVDQSWLEEDHNSLGDSDVCGEAIVFAGVVPDRSEYEGETFEIEPVNVTIGVSNDAFDAFHHQAVVAFGQHRIISAEVMLSGDALPDKESGVIFLDELDISKTQKYAVTSIEMSNTRYFDHSKGRVMKVERDRDEGFGINISVLLSDANYTIYTEYVHASGIGCEGRVIKSWGKPYDGAEVSIEFHEFESNQFEELPEKAFFGEFSYWPKQPDEKDSSASFSFNLNYVPEDARDLIIPLLNGENKKQVILEINLARGKEELSDVNDMLKGNVRSYSFSVHQHFNSNT